MDVDAGGTYRPKTRDTQAAYETLLAVVQEKLGDYATDVIAGAADEILGILKSTGLKVSLPFLLRLPPSSPLVLPCLLHRMVAKKILFWGGNREQHGS